jgi:FAD synthase
VPTANIEMNSHNTQLTRSLIPGVYSAIGWFTKVDDRFPFLKSHEQVPMACALTIGWNPVYDNANKTIEVFIIDDFEMADFHG